MGKEQPTMLQALELQRPGREGIGLKENRVKGGPRQGWCSSMLNGMGNWGLNIG